MDSLQPLVSALCDIVSAGPPTDITLFTGSGLETASSSATIAPSLRPTTFTGPSPRASQSRLANPNAPPEDARLWSSGPELGSFWCSEAVYASQKVTALSLQIVID